MLLSVRFAGSNSGEGPPMIRRITLFLSLVLGTTSLFTSKGFSQIHDGTGASSPRVFASIFKDSVDGKNRQEALRVSVDLVMVPVTVTDGLNHPQTNLTREDFTVYEGSQPQPIRYFSAEDSPISVGLLLDVSGSMRDKMDSARL